MIKKAVTDSTILQKHDFDESDYAINEIHPAIAATIRDILQVKIDP